MLSLSSEQPAKKLVRHNVDVALVKATATNFSADKNRCIELAAIGIQLLFIIFIREHLIRGLEVRQNIEDSTL